MEWHPNMYVGETAQQKKKELIQKIENGKTPFNTFLLVVPAKGNSQLEMVPVRNLKFWYGHKSCPLIVGLGFGREETLGLIRQIIRDVWTATGGADVRRYFLKL